MKTSNDSNKKSGKGGFFADSQVFEDLSRMAGNAFGSMAGIRQEIETRIREYFESFAAKIDMVRRDEFEAVKQMAAKARLEQEDLKKRLDDLEQKLAKKSAKS